MLKLVQNGGAYVASPVSWIDEGSCLTKDVKVTARQQALPHPLFANSILHAKILKEQQKLRRNSLLSLQNNVRKLKDHRYIGSQPIMTAGKYERLVEKIESERRDRLYSRQELDTLCDTDVSDEAVRDETVEDEELFWNMMNRDVGDERLSVDR